MQVNAELANEMKARGTFRSPTLCAIRGILDNADEVPEYAVTKAASLEAQGKDSFRRAVRAGVRHVCGTDAGTPFNPHGNAPHELIYMVQWGMTPLKAMQAATANGAELLRLPDVGTIEDGQGGRPGPVRWQPGRVDRARAFAADGHEGGRRRRRVDRLTEEGTRTCSCW